MCGIAGYVTEGRHEPSSALLESMCDQIAHRGPDAYGYFRAGGVALGHRRLSIIDVTGGDQPLGNEDGSIQIVFNGEIYNYLELRQGLVQRGHRFVTASDTEVLVHLYEEVGSDLPVHLNGMFAFAIWDERKQELFLARDRFGKKPLYFTSRVPGFRLCFASELKALGVMPGFDRIVSPRSVADFLTFAYVPDPNSIFAGAEKLPPGHSLLLTRDGFSQRRYWKPSFAIRDDITLEEAQDELLALALDSVERRMISDVPLGGFLSGGVDSSSVVALMCQRAAGRVKSFSIGFTDEEFDEVAYARQVAGRYGTEHHEHVVSPAVEEMLKVLVDHYDEPFADSSAIPTLYLARMTRQYVTVALSGDGADELFGGYRRYRFALAEEQVRRKLPRWFRRTAVRLAGRLCPKLDYLPRVFRAKATLEGIARELGEAYFEAMSGFRRGLLDRMLAPGLRRELDGYSPREWYLERFAAHAELPPLQQLQAVDLETYLPGDILVKLDRATMAYSLEGRCPFLDYRIGDLAGSLPAPLKLANGVGKRVLKETMRPYLPGEIIDRRKMGFSVPMASWMRTSLKPVFEAVALHPDMGRYVNLDCAREVWLAHQSGARDYSRELWSMLMLACWHDRFGAASPAGRLAEALERQAAVA